MTVIALSFVIGIVAGLRTMTAPAAISWAARFGHLHLDGSWLAFLANAWSPWILTVAAIGEFVGDKLPQTPSRKLPVGFVARIASGCLCGAAIGVSSQNMLSGLLAGAIGSVAGTLGGAEARLRLVAATGGRDLPIALLEDAVAIGCGVLVGGLVS